MENDAQIRELWTNLKLTEEEESTAVEISEADFKEAQGSFKYCLAGKLWSDRPFNIDAMLTTLKSIWRPAKGLICKRLEDNLFLFQFFARGDFFRVMEGSPWSFDQHILLLKKLSRDERPSEVNLHCSPFWIHLADLPMGLMTKQMATKLGQQLGEVLEVDEDQETAGWGKDLRVRVLIDVQKPLKRVIPVQIPNQTRSILVKVSYERLPNFCFHCGRLGHTYKECESFEEAEPSAARSHPYGTWMRATPPRRRINGMLGDRGGMGGSNSWRSFGANSPDNRNFRRAPNPNHTEDSTGSSNCLERINLPGAEAGQKELEFGNNLAVEFMQKETTDHSAEANVIFQSTHPNISLQQTPIHSNSFPVIKDKQLKGNAKHSNPLLKVSKSSSSFLNSPSHKLLPMNQLVQSLDVSSPHTSYNLDSTASVKKWKRHARGNRQVQTPSIQENTTRKRDKASEGMDVDILVSELAASKRGKLANFDAEELSKAALGVVQGCRDK